MRLVARGQVGIGLQLPVQAQSRVFAEAWERDAGPEEIVAVAQAAEDAGFLYVGVCDHLAIPASHRDTMRATWYDPIATLSYLAASTQRIRLLTHVYVLGLRAPIAAAKALATLDRLSDGRLIIGVGAGHVAEEFRQVGVDFAARGAILDEHIDALRVLLRDEVASFHGERVQLDELAVGPRPVQQPPPIWIGGSSGPALRRAARRGDGWIPQGTPLREMPDQIAAIARHLDGRELADLDLGGMALPMYLGEPDWDVGRWTISGSADELAARIRDFVDLGCSHVQVRLRSRSVDELLDQLGRFGSEVIPALR